MNSTKAIGVAICCKLIIWNCKLLKSASLRCEDNYCFQAQCDQGITDPTGTETLQRNLSFAKLLRELELTSVGCH